MSEILTNTGITLWGKDDYGELWLSVFEQLTGSAGKSNLRLIDESIGKINESLDGYSLVYKDDKLYISKDGVDISVSLVDSITGNIASSVDGKTITIDENGVIHGMTVDDAFDLTSTNAISNSVVSNKFAEVDEKLNTASTTIETLGGDGEGSIKNIAENAAKSVVTEEVSKEVAKIVDNAPEDFDTLKEMSDWISGHKGDASEMNTAIKKNESDISEHTSNANIHVTADEKEIVSKLGESDDGNLTYNGESIKGGGSSIVVSTTQPSNPNVGDLWFVVDEKLLNVNYLKNANFVNNSNGLTTYTSTTSLETVDNWFFISSAKSCSIDILNNGVRLYFKPTGDNRRNVGLYQNVKFRVPNLSENPDKKYWYIVFSGKISNTSVTDNINVEIGVSNKDEVFMSGNMLRFFDDDGYYGVHNYVLDDGSFQLVLWSPNIYNLLDGDWSNGFYAQALIDFSDTVTPENTEAIDECTIQDLSLKIVLEDYFE